MVQALDLEETSRRLRISIRTVRRFAKAGRIAHRRIGRRLVFIESDVLEFLDRHRVPARDEETVS